jgi:hypothetical protein
VSRASGAQRNETPISGLPEIGSQMRASRVNPTCVDPGVTPQLVCVPPDRVAAAWPHVRALIPAAMKRGGLSSFRPVEASVLAGDALLWLAWDPGAARITAAAVTELHATEWRRVCVIVACGGASGRLRASSRAMGMRAWLPLLEGIEAYARATGCAAVRIMGRKGWIRLLGDYRVKRIVLEKDL